jgi:antitoxin (DNA-binding transcriptional repressor) of toxin-antitoxin stability system
LGTPDSILLIGQKRPQGRQEGRQLLGHRLPDDVVIDIKVGMNQAIPHGNDRRPGNLRCRGPRCFRDSAGGFSNYPPTKPSAFRLARTGHHEGHQDHEDRSLELCSSSSLVNFVLLVVFISRRRTRCDVLRSLQNPRHDVRNRLPAVIEDVATSSEPLVVTGYGKPIASIVPFRGTKSPESRYPLRGKPIAVAADFDERMPALWAALAATVW